jgi:hypothetical protein
VVSSLQTLDRSRTHATVAVLVALTLYELLPARLVVGPLWIAPVMVLAVLVPLTVMRARGVHYRRLRSVAIVMIAIVNFFNIASVALLVRELLNGSWHATGSQLLLAGLQIWLTNVIVFGLWYWELDGGGPFPRSQEVSARESASADFLFPQMAVNPAYSPWIGQNWKPQFADYLYLAFVTATAFSPADVMPLSTMAKMLMLVEALISLVTITLVLARAVGVLA